MDKLSFMSITLVCLISGCGGSDPAEENGETNGGEGRQTLSGDHPNFPQNTVWSFNSIPTSDSCDEFNYNRYTLTINYDSNGNTIAINISGSDGDASGLTLTGTTDSSITLSGSIADDDGTTTFTDLELNFTSDDFLEYVTVFVGTVDWEWRDDAEVCSGGASINGILNEVDDGAVLSDNNDFDGVGDLNSSVGDMDYTIGDTSGNAFVSYASPYIQDTYLLIAYDSTLSAITSAGEGRITAISMSIIPFTGPGVYNNTDNQSGYDVTLNYSRQTIDNFVTTSYYTCYGYEDGDGLEGSPTNISIEIVETQQGHRGTVTGTVNCFAGDFEEEFLGTESVSVSYNSTTKLD